MIEQVRTELLHILDKIPEIIDDSAKLAELSDYSIRSASIYQDSDSISIAIIAYSLSKMVSRYESHDLPNWEEFYPEILKELERSKDDINADDISGFRHHVKEVVRMIGRCDKNIKLYVDKVIEKARIKKGSKIFEQGVSVQRAAKLMGISVWELMNYIGKTEIIDKDPVRTDPKGRIRFAKKLFNVK